MTAGAYCNRDVVVTGPETSAYEVAKLMREHHVTMGAAGLTSTHKAQ